MPSGNTPTSLSYALRMKKPPSIKKKPPTLILSRRVEYPSLPPIQCYAEKTKTNPSPKKR